MRATRRRDAGGRPPVGSRRQAAAGLAALLLAGAALVAGGPLLTPGIAGRAAAAPLPAPPAVGACVLFGDQDGDADGEPAGGQDGGSDQRSSRDAVDLRTVSCDSDHDAEVTATWTADDPDRADVDRQTCRGVANSYAGLTDVLTVAEWAAAVRAESRVILAPDGQRTVDRGWVICTLGPASGEQFRGTLAGRPFAAGPTPGFSRCAVDAAGGSAVSCSLPHRSELLGGAHGSYVPEAGEDADRPLPSELWPDLALGCTALAARLFRTDDPTYDGVVRIEVRPGLIGRNGAIGWYWSADCTMTVVGDRTLVGSMVGVGDHPLPYG